MSDSARSVTMTNEVFEASLTWFVEGTLDPTETARFERYLSECPEAAARVEAYRAFAQAAKHKWRPIPNQAPNPAKLLQRIRADHEELTGDFWQRLTDWFRGNRLVPRLAACAAVGIMVVQAVLIAALQRDLSLVETRYAEYRSTTASDWIGPFARVTFRPQTREADIRMLLVGVRGSIAGGPSQLGDYYVFLPPERANEIIDQLRQSPIVSSAELVTRVPELD